VWAAAAEGDPLAAEVLSEMTDTLALGLANVAFLLDPELIVLGGGVSRVGDRLLLPLRERLSALLAHPVRPRLELSQLGPYAQLYGALHEALAYANRQVTASPGEWSDG
jgi:glucokinase